VTGVCSARNHEWVHALGADKVIDYTQEDFTEGEERYDFIFDAVGKVPKSKRKSALAPNGSFAAITDNYKETTENLVFVRELVEAGEIRPVIDRRYSLEEVPEAHRYVETWRKKGNVVVVVEHEGGN
jgi:NADPH:quinone reductase-like Zn-dependent oxidoreductase